MQRRSFITNIIATGSLLGLGLNPFKKENIMTVGGPINAENLGITLAHEHVLVDFGGADNYDPSSWDPNTVLKSLLPYFQELKRIGIDSVFEFTPAFLGRDPQLLKAISDQTGINLITNTGFYGAVDNKFLPKAAFNLNPAQLADLWIEEFKNGIEGTGIKPGFIKISVNPGPLSELHQKLVKAAALTHLKTGLTIASHTGPAVPAFEQLALLQDSGVHPSAFIWVHAQNEQDHDLYLKAAESGTWISLDGVQQQNVDQYLESLVFMRKHNMLNKVLISQDAGWYEPDKPWNGPKRSYTDLHNYLIPKLKQNGFQDSELDLLLKSNPAKAFTIGVRKT